MESHHNELAIINSICAALDPLFQQHGFNQKIRETEKSVFIEVVIYEKGPVQFRIAVCMHPHDYPNSLNVDLNRKTAHGWDYKTIYDFIKIGEIDLIDEPLFLVPENVVETTIKRLYEICEFVLVTKRYLE